MGRLAAIVTALLFAGVPVARAADAPVSRQEWIAVVHDWLDNDRFDTGHSCGALVDAIGHLEAFPSPPSIDAAAHAIRRYGRRVCTHTPHVGRIAVGMSDTAVAAIAGMPNTVLPRCWLYTVTSTHEGRRVCFANGRVVRIWRSVHG